MADKKKNKPVASKPSRKKAKPAGSNGRGFTRSLAGVKSPQDYKDWINGIMASIKPDYEDTLTEEEWVEAWKEFWSKADSVSETKETTIAEEPFRKMSVEEQYPGITEQMKLFQEAELPSCPHCGSENTASVQVGIIGRTIKLAASTSKFKLVQNMENKLGEYFCNECRKYFD